MLALREGWSLEISRLSRIKTLSSEAPEDKTEKSSKETLLPVCFWCDKTLESVLVETALRV